MTPPSSLVTCELRGVLVSVFGIGYLSWHVGIIFFKTVLHTCMVTNKIVRKRPQKKFAIILT